MHVTMLFETPVITDEHRNALFKMTPFGQCVGIDATGKFGSDFDDMLAVMKAARQYVECCDVPELLAVYDAAIAKAEGR